MVTVTPVLRFIITEYSFQHINTYSRNYNIYTHLGASLIAQLIKNPPAMQETPVRSLGWEDPLEKELATHSSILAGRTPWTKESGRLQSIESQRIGHALVTEQQQ